MSAALSTASDDVQTRPSEQSSEDPNPPLLTEREAAKTLRMSPRSLRRLRDAGTGPAFIRPGPRKVLYARGALTHWLDSRTFHCTAEADDGLALRGEAND